MNQNLSIIIPVYNVESYLDRCLNSIQPYIDAGHEIIIVNDGSTDNSQNIIEKFCTKNPKIIYIYQNNAGLGAARNTGLKYATREYVWFIDSDDYVDDFIADLNSVITFNPDVIVFGRTENYKDWQISLPKGLYNGRHINGQQYLNRAINDGTFRTNVWDKIFNRELLNKYRLKFVEGLLYEDMYFTLSAFMFAQEVVTISKFPYHYVQYNDGSITKSIRINDLDVLKFIELTEQFISQQKYEFSTNSQEYHKLIFNWVSSCLLNKYSYLSLTNYDAKYIFSETIKHPIFLRSAHYCSTHNVGLRQTIFANLLLKTPTLYKIILHSALKIQQIIQRIQ